MRFCVKSWKADKGTKLGIKGLGQFIWDRLPQGCGKSSLQGSIHGASQRD